MLAAIEREPGTRALTAMLKQAGEKWVYLNGHRGPRQKIIVDLIWQYLVTGEVTLQSGLKLTASSRDWITALKWVFAQIDGKPPTPTIEPEKRIMTMEWVNPIPYWQQEDNDENSDEEGDTNAFVSVDRALNAASPTPETAADPPADHAPAHDIRESGDVGFTPQSESSHRAVFEAGVAADRRAFTVTLPSEPEKSPPSRPPVVSRRHDGSIVLIDRDDYDRRREQGFRSRTRYTISRPPPRFG